MRSPDTIRYRFDQFEVDLHARVLFFGSEPVAMAPRTVDTLIVLLENAGRIMSKEELMRAIWPDRVVEEVNLTQHVSLLRRALASRAEGVEYVRNYPSRGYQFVQPVEAIRAPSSPPAPIVKAPPDRKPGLWIAAAGLLVTIAAALPLAIRSASPSRHEPRRVPISRLPGGKWHPALSPDGTRIAFVWDQSGVEPCLWVKREDEEVPKQIPGSCGNPGSPAWSPDGLKLAYLRHRPSATEIVIHDGLGPERILAKLFPVRSLISNRMLDWSPDGRSLAFCDKSPADAALSIFVLAIDTGERRRVTSPLETDVGDTDPTFSPDGQSLAFVRMPSRFNSHLFVTPVSGGAVREIAAGDQRIGGVAWPAGSSEVLFSSNRDGSYRLWRVDPDSHALPYADPSAVAGENPIHISVSRTRKRLAYVVSGEDLNIWRLRLRPKGTPEWTRLIASTGVDAAPQYSPDGRSVCFLSDRSGAEQIWVAQADGSNPRQVTRENYLPGHCRWTPDSSNILFTAHAGGKNGIYIASVGGGDIRPIPIEGGGSLPLMTADGRRLLVVRGHSGRFDLFVTSPDGGASRQLTRSGAHRPKLAANGTDIFYVKDRTSSSIWKIDSAGGEPVRVFDGLIPGYFGFWAPSPKGIYYLGEDSRTEHPVLSFFDFASGQRTPIVDIPALLPPLGLAELSLSPDGNDLLMVRRESSSSDLVALYDFQ